MNAPRFQELVNRINPGSRTDLMRAYEGFHYSAGALPLAVKHRRGKRFGRTSRRRVSLRLAIFSVSERRCYVVAPNQL